MTEQVNNSTTRMPPAEQIAVEAIARLAAEGYTSSVMQLSRPTLNELARRMVTPGETDTDTLAWLNAQESAPSSGIARSSFGRWSQRFRETYKVLWGEYATRIVTGRIEAATPESVAKLHSYIRGRTLEVIAQELASATTPGDLDTSRLNSVLMAIGHFDNAAKAQAELQLKVADAERKAAKLESDLALANQKLARLPEQVQALQERIDELSKRAQRGDQIPAEVFARIRAELGGIAA